LLVVNFIYSDYLASLCSFYLSFLSYHYSVILRIYSLTSNHYIVTIWTVEIFPNKQQVTCFYCDWNGGKDKAKDHCTRQHPGKTLKLKFKKSNMEKLFQKKIQETETITDFINDDEQEQEQ